MKSRPFKSLIRPYAVVRWHGRKVGQEEIVRPSLNPLFCSSLQNAHLINRCGLPPQGGQLCFGGQPYIFRLTPANGRALDRHVPTKHKIGVTLDIYSAKGDMHESQAHLDLFLGQAILESPMANSSLASYCTLPLRRRREDTLNNAFVMFRLSRVAEETIELNVSSLKLSGIAAAERRLAEKHEAETVPSASESFNSPRAINSMLHTVCRLSGVVAVRSLGFDPSSLVDVRTGGRRVTPESTAQITSHFKCVLGGYAG